MDNSFGVWLMVAGVAALALLLLFGSPLADQQVDSSSATVDTGTVEETSSYWHPVAVQEAPAPSVVSTPTWTPVSVIPQSISAPCSTCNSAHAAASTPQLVGGCGHPSTPCTRVPCRCRPAHTTVGVPTVVPAPPSNVPLVGGCGYPSTPCRATACVPLERCCSDLCADPCHAVKPGINRNMPLCVNECSFIQLHSTVSHPICEQVCFEWSASKGWFLDPGASDPLYFAPSTQFCDGEDVWITLVITDASGVQYSDVVSLHIRDLP